jgi:2-polyprenyl-3-methyl-5-hydroxy-6-metoxy-1,4-benzoquinol methylase
MSRVREQRNEVFFSSTDRLHGVPGEFSYHICNECRTVFQNPMVVREDLHLCYPEEYAPYNLMSDRVKLTPDALTDESFRGKLRKAIVDEVKGRTTKGLNGSIARMLAKSAVLRERAFFGIVTDECLPKGKGEHLALDLGCGTGWLIENLNAVGWKTDGVEWSERAAEHARKVTDGTVWSGDFRDVDIPKGKYELIVLNHVFEHIRDPKDVLRRVYELLNEGGTAVLNYPNPYSVGARWYGSNWFHWDPPRHLVFPPGSILEDLAADAGFSEIAVGTRSRFTNSQWAHSKNREKRSGAGDAVPQLGIIERIGVLVETMLTRSGFSKGWEITATLKK